MSNIVLSTNRNNCRIIAGQCQRWDQNDYCSTRGSLILFSVQIQVQVDTNTIQLHKLQNIIWQQIGITSVKIMIVSPAGASSCCSQPPRSSPGPMTMIRPWSEIGCSDQDLHKIIMISSSKIRSQAAPSPGQLCPHCHHNAMVILTEVTFPVLVLGDKNAGSTRPPPAEPNGQLLDLAQTSDHRRQRCAYIQSSTHTRIYITQCIYMHSTHTHTKTLIH